MRSQARRRFLQGSLALGGLGLLSGCGVVPMPGQRAVGPHRIGFLETGTAVPRIDVFREGLHDLGYVEGQDVLIEYRDAEGNLERLPGLAAELVGLPVEVIVVSDNASALAAGRTTSTIPIVASGGNILAAGLVTTIARPEGNITGVTTNSAETVGKWIELLKETVPTISRLAVVRDMSPSPGHEVRQAVQRAAETLQLESTWYDLRDLEHLPAVLSTARAERADGLVVVSGGVLGGGHNPRIGGAALKARLPAVAEQRDFAGSGGLLAHGTVPGALARRSASYVDKLLKGAKPGDLPIELPTEFNIVVNLKTAQELGIAVPQSVLARATELIQ